MYQILYIGKYYIIYWTIHWIILETKMGVNFDIDYLTIFISPFFVSGFVIKRSASFLAENKLFECCVCLWAIFKVCHYYHRSCVLLDFRSGEQKRVMRCGAFAKASSATESMKFHSVIRMLSCDVVGRGYIHLRTGDKGRHISRAKGPERVEPKLESS